MSIDNDTLYLKTTSNQLVEYQNPLTKETIYFDIQDSTYLYQYKNIPTSYVLVSTGVWFEVNGNIRLKENKNVFLKKYIYHYDIGNKIVLYKEHPNYFIIKGSNFIIDTLNLALDQFYRKIDIEDSILLNLGIKLKYDSLFQNNMVRQAECSCQNQVKAILPGVVISVDTANNKLLILKILQGETICEYNNLKELSVEVGQFVNIGDMLGVCTEKTRFIISGIGVE